jgi:LacI family gluconate utilization system Gnt-I transcriptional repressor
VMQRAEGYRRALQAADCYDPALEFLRPEPSSFALGAQMFGRIVAEAKPDAIFFCNDDLAQGALMAAPRLGISVPRDVAVAGFNDLPGSDQLLPSLTSVRTPRREIGQAAAGMLLQLMRGTPVEQSCIELAWEVVARESA